MKYESVIGVVLYQHDGHRLVAARTLEFEKTENEVRLIGASEIEIFAEEQCIDGLGNDRWIDQDYMYQHLMHNCVLEKASDLLDTKTKEAEAKEKSKQ